MKTVFLLLHNLVEKKNDLFVRYQRCFGPLNREYLENKNVMTICYLQQKRSLSMTIVGWDKLHKKTQKVIAIS